METFLRCSAREFGIVKEVPRPSWQTIPLDAKGFIEFRPLWYLGYLLFSQASSLRMSGVPTGTSSS